MIDAMVQFLRSLRKKEVYFFYVLLAVMLVPIWAFETFPTVDGPAHLYNSRLIFEMLTGSSNHLSNYLEFNQSLIPNWIGHFLLSSLLAVFPALVAEKIILSLHIILLPIAIRHLMKEHQILRNDSLWALYFVFPFCYSFLFYFGFYNFLLGLVLFFFTCGYWLKCENNGQMRSKNWIILSLLILALYFSHLFVFILFVGFVGYHLLLNLHNTPRTGKSFAQQVLTNVTLLLPGIILTTLYLFNHRVDLANSPQTLTFYESWLMIQNTDPARAVSYGKEGIFTKWIFILFLLIIGNLLVVRLRNLKARIGKDTLLWLGLTLALLIAFFCVPDGFTFNKARLLLFFFLFFILFISTQKVNRWIQVLCFVLINYVNVALLKIYYLSSSKANEVSQEILAASELIDPYSTVLPINESGNWLFAHVSNYLGVNKPILLLENYEAAVDYFPLKWNRKGLPDLNLGDTTVAGLTYPSNPSNSPKQIDYIFLLTNDQNPEIKGEMETSLQAILEKNYAAIFVSQSKKIKLYKKLD